MERIDKILAVCGFGTRREVKKLIKSGLVTANGKTVFSADEKFDEKTAEIAVNGIKAEYKKYVYLMLNKPAGYVSATEDNVYPTVTQLVPESYSHYGVFPVGRLDVDTEGLLILTNDGKFAHNAMSPKKHVPKKYFAVTKNPVVKKDIEAFEAGMDLGDFTAMPSLLEHCDGGCLVTIYEGKFHQVKRMFEKTGNCVLYLKRVQIGGLCLDESLEPGCIKELSEGEIEKIWI